MRVLAIGPALGTMMARRIAISSAAGHDRHPFHPSAPPRSLPMKIGIGCALRVGGPHGGPSGPGRGRRSVGARGPSRRGDARNRGLHARAQATLHLAADPCPLRKPCRSRPHDLVITTWQRPSAGRSVESLKPLLDPDTPVASAVNGSPPLGGISTGYAAWLQRAARPPHRPARPGRRLWEMRSASAALGWRQLLRPTRLIEPAWSKQLAGQPLQSCAKPDGGRLAALETISPGPGGGAVPSPVTHEIPPTRSGSSLARNNGDRHDLVPDHVDGRVAAPDPDLKPVFPRRRHGDGERVGPPPNGSARRRLDAALAAAHNKPTGRRAP